MAGGPRHSRLDRTGAGIVDFDGGVDTSFSRCAPPSPSSFSLLAATLAAAGDERDPIDVIWEDCAGGGEGPNAEQMVACHVEAESAWDLAMDEAYASLR